MNLKSNKCIIYSYPNAIHLNSRQIHAVQRAFHIADEENKGFLSKDDIKVAVLMLFGHKPSKLEVVQLLQTYGSEPASEERGVTLSQFTEAMKPKFAAVDENEQIRSTFMAFDRSCRGFLTEEDVKQIFQQECPHFAAHRVELAFRELDRDGDGRISYKDFDFIMKFNNLS